MATKFEEKQNRFVIAVKMLMEFDTDLGIMTSSRLLEMLSEDAWLTAAERAGHKSGNPSEKTREAVRQLAELRETL